MNQAPTVESTQAGTDDGDNEFAFGRAPLANPDSRLVHRPCVPVRASFVGEVTFAEQWELLAGQVAVWRSQPTGGELSYFDLMFRSYPALPGQREATIAASVLTWLGTNCGMAYLHFAQRVHAQFSEFVAGALLPDAYLMAWARENARHLGTNSGVTLLEHLLSGPLAARLPQDHPNPYRKPNRQSVRHVISRPSVATPNASNTSADPHYLGALDLEAAECAVRWVGSTNGQRWLQRCEKLSALRKTAGELRRLEAGGWGQGRAAAVLREQIQAAAEQGVLV